MPTTAPTNLTGDATIPTSATLTFDDKSDSEDKFVFERRTNPEW